MDETHGPDLIVCSAGVVRPEDQEVDTTDRKRVCDKPSRREQFPAGILFICDFSWPDEPLRYL
jgi:hypothetical protein